MSLRLENSFCYGLFPTCTTSSMRKPSNIRSSSRVSGLLSSLLIGQLALNVIVDADENGFFERLGSLIKSLVSCVQELSMNCLESSSFAPSMDYDTSKICPGAPLQIADGTRLLINECSLTPGKLSEQATRNVQSLIDLTVHQTVSFDFGGHHVQIPCDVPVISVSHGNSVLPFEWRIKYVPKTDMRLPSGFNLNKFRIYFEQVRRTASTLSQSVAQVKTFVLIFYICATAIGRRICKDQICQDLWND